MVNYDEWSGLNRDQREALSILLASKINYARTMNNYHLTFKRIELQCLQQALALQADHYKEGEEVRVEQSKGYILPKKE